MTAVLLAYYCGLLVFVLNGLQLHALRSKQYELRAQEERLKRLLLRAKIRRVK